MAVIYLQSQKKYVVSMSGFDQITGQYSGEIPLSASDPTLKLFVWLCNRFLDVVSFATLLLLTQLIV